MAVRMVRLGSARVANEGLRLGTVRRPPRGVRKADFARRDFFDVWVPELAPSAAVVKWALSVPWTDARWRHYERTYRREMNAAPAARLIDLLAALSHQTDFSVGCYCENPARCHRNLLLRMLKYTGAKVVG